MIPGIITMDNPDKEAIYRSIAEENRKHEYSGNGPVIDFHTHSFPPSLAAKALSSLTASSGIRSYTEGTNEALQRSMAEAGVDRCVVLPVATHDRQHKSINDTAFAVNEQFSRTGLLSFGSLHPDNNYREILALLDRHGIRGIKLHPVFQGVDFNDIRYKRIVGCACEYGMVVILHAGFDVSFPGQQQALPEKILEVVQDVRPDKLVLAHLGGWDCWDDVERLLVGQPVWMDTSYSVTPVEHTDGTVSRHLSTERFERIIRSHGADRILFGSDSPWGSQQTALRAVTQSNLTDEEKSSILGGNADRLLGGVI